MPWPDAFARFLERPVPKFLHLAAARPGRSPIGCRGYGALRDGDDLLVYISQSDWHRFRETLRDGQPLAALLTSGIDNESYQAKGACGGGRDMRREDVSALERERDFVRATFPDLLTVVAIDPANCVAVAIHSPALYVQTPGPAAGAPLTERSV